MKTQGIIHALLLDGAGSATSLNQKEISHWQPEQGILWLHLDYSENNTQELIANSEDLGAVAGEFLLTEDTRPRVIMIEDALLCSFRGVNCNPDSNPEDMVAVRLWTNGSKIITSIKRNILSINEIIDTLQSGNGPKNSSEFIVDLTKRLAERMEPVLEGMEDELAALEDQIFETGNLSNRYQISEIKRKVVALKRYILPQKEAVSRLYEVSLKWFSQEEKILSREVTNLLQKYIEILDSVRERAMVMHDEIIRNQSEQINNKMYVLSLITAVFLPLSLLTGIFGINVAGIPGTDNEFAFMLFVGCIILIGVGLLFFLRKKRWL